MNKDELNMSDRLSRRDFLKVAGAATVSTFLAACGFDPNSTEIDPTNTPLPIPISTKEIHSAGQYEFIEESEIISKLPGPFKAFTNDQKIKDLFTDPTSIEYSASGIKVYDLNDNPTAYTFFNATSTKEEKGRTAMIFGGDQGEVVYIVLNRIIDSDGSVGLGITQDPATGNDLEKSLMIFDTGLSETQIEKMTIKELSSINVNFIPGGILVPSEKLLGSKVQAMLLKPEIQPSESMLTNNALENGKWGDYSLIENPDGYYEMKDVQGNLIPEVKLFRDGTAELTYSSKKLAVAFQAISVGAEGQLALGLWDFKNGEWSMAPGYTAEDVRAGEFANDYHKLVVIRGNDEIEKKLTDTIFMARDLYMNNTEGYRPESEFEGITVVTLNGKTIENFDGPAKEWKMLRSVGVHEAGIFYLKPNLNYPGVIAEVGSRDSDGAPLQVALGIGYFSVTIINPRYNQEMSVLHVPVVAKEPNKILNLSALVNISDLPRLNPYLENKETRGGLFIWIVKATQPHLTQYFIADPVLLGFVGEANRNFFSSIPVLPSISFAPKYNSLPSELKSVFFTLLEND